MDRWIDFAGEVVPRLLVVAAVLVFFLWVVRPLMKWLLTSRPGTACRTSPGKASRSLSVSSDDATREPDEEGGPPRTPSRRELIQNLAQSDPDKAGELVKRWIHSQK